VGRVTTRDGSILVAASVVGVDGVAGVVSAVITASVVSVVPGGYNRVSGWSLFVSVSRNIANGIIQREACRGAGCVCMDSARTHVER